MAIEVSSTHGYYRALNALVYVTYFMWMGVLAAAISAVSDYFHAVGFSPASLADLLPDHGWWNIVFVILLVVASIIGLGSFFMLSAYLNAMTTGRWIHTLSTWLYIRIALKTPVSFTDAADLMWLFAPNKSGKWYPMKEVAAVSRDQRRAALLAKAEQIERDLWPERFPPAGWYEDPEYPGQQRYWEGAAWTASAGPAPGAPHSVSSRARRFLAWGRPPLHWIVAVPLLLLALSTVFSAGSGTPLSIGDDPERVTAEFKYQGLHDAQARSLTEALRYLGVDSISMVNVIDARTYPQRLSEVQLGIDDGGMAVYYYVTFDGDEVDRIWRDDPRSTARELTLYSERKPNPEHFSIKELGGKERLLADALDAAVLQDMRFADFVWDSRPSISRIGTDTVSIYGLHDVDRENEVYVVRFRVWRDADRKMQKELDEVYQGVRLPDPPMPSRPPGN